MPLAKHRMRSKKRQTTLSFDPVQPGSSPSNSALPAARVRYDVPGQKGLRRLHKAQHVTDNSYFNSSGDQEISSIASPPRKKTDGSLPFEPLPTPAKSSQAENVARVSNGAC